MSVNEQRAPEGQKQIKVSLRFATDDIASMKGLIVPKFCWEGGFVSVKANETHGIRATEGMPFTTLDEIPGVVHAALDEAGVRMIFRSDARGRRPRLRG